MAGVSQKISTCSPSAPEPDLRLAVDAHDAAAAAAPASDWLEAGADVDGAERGAEPGGNRPARCAHARQLRIGRAAQALAGASAATAASSRLVLPEPLAPVSTTGAGPTVSDRPA